MATKTKYPNGYKPKIKYHEEQAWMWEAKAKEEMKKYLSGDKGAMTLHNSYMVLKKKSWESVIYFTKKQNELEGANTPS